MVFKAQTFNRGVRRHSINTLFPASAKELQSRVHVHLRVVKFRDRRGRHDVAAVDQHRVVVGGGDVAVLGNVFIQLDVHQPVFGQPMQGAGFGFTRLQPLHRLGHRHLVDDHLPLLQRDFRDAVARLDQRRFTGVRGGRHTRRALEKAPNIDGIDGVVRTLVNDFQHIVRADDRRRDLNSARSPTIGQRHLTRTKRHLVAGNRHRLEQRAADHALGAFVEVGEVEVRLHIVCGRLRTLLQTGFLQCVHAVTPVSG